MEHNLNRLWIQIGGDRWRVEMASHTKLHRCTDSNRIPVTHALQFPYSKVADDKCVAVPIIHALSSHPI